MGDFTCSHYFYLPSWRLDEGGGVSTLCFSLYECASKQQHAYITTCSNYFYLPSRRLDEGVGEVSTLSFSLY